MQEGIKGKRMQFELSPIAFARFKEIQRAGKMKSNADVFRCSISLLEWYLGQKMAGNRIAVARRGGRWEEVKFAI